MATAQYRKNPRRQHAPDDQWFVFPSYKGGATTTSGGYVWEFVGPHPLANRWGFVAQHRLIGADLVERPLRKGEVVHHRDNDRANNDPANLEVMTVEAHRRHHFAELGDLLRIPIDPAELQEQLTIAGSVKGAARAMGIDHNVIRRRFPELCSAYIRQSPTCIDNPRDLERIREGAADPNQGVQALAKELRMSAITIQRICKRRGWVWQKKSRGPWKPDDPRRLRLSANRAGLKVGEKRPAPAIRDPS